MTAAHGLRALRMSLSKAGPHLPQMIQSRDEQLGINTGDVRKLARIWRDRRHQLREPCTPISLGEESRQLFLLNF
jgi:hypothetical protein